MEKKKMFKPYDDKEFMREAILKQDQIFKQQVHELHRLYRTQKVLMSGIQTNSNQLPNHTHVITSQPIILAPDSDNINNNDAAGTATNSINYGRFGLAAQTRIIEEEEIELTLGPSTYNGSSSSNQEKRIENRAILLIDQKEISGTTSGRQSPSSNSSSSSSSTTGYSSSQNKRRFEGSTASILKPQQKIGRSRPRYHMMSLLGGGLINGSAAARVLQGGGSSSSEAANMSSQSGTVGGNIKTNNNHGGEHLRGQAPAWFLDQALSLKLT